jgi:biopolymer transport protein ExbD
MALHRKSQLAPKEDAEPGELNVVPYLDILMNLIIFMLLSMAGLATWGMVNINAPHVTPPGPREQQAPELLLTVGVAKSGFFIASSGAVTTPIPRTADGRYDYDALNLRLQQVKAAFPLESRVIITADGDTDYDALVATVDAARETRDRKLLFPDVTLAHF